MKQSLTLFVVTLMLADLACNFPVPLNEDKEMQVVTSSPPVTAESGQTPTSTPESAVICVDEACMEQTPFNYLIVTRPVFEDALQPFIQWKTEQGFRVGLVTVEWLDQTFDGLHLAERMKTGMHHLRKAAGVTFVLLVGDTMIDKPYFPIDVVMRSYTFDKEWNVPTGFYRRYVDIDPPGEVLPSDAYFVEDRDWDPGNTGLNPVTDPQYRGGVNGSFDATLFVGRWPVRRPREIEAIVNKTKLAAPADRIFFTASSEFENGKKTLCPGAFPPAGDQASYYCYLDLFVSARKNLFEANTPWLTTESMFPDINDPVQDKALMDKFLSYEGVLAVSYHGTEEYLLMGPGCCREQQLQFQHVLPVLVTQSCSISAFYAGVSPSLSEVLLQRPSGPATIAEPPNPYTFMELLAQGKSVGEALWRSGSVYVFWPNPISLFGDPSLVALQTGTP